MKDKKSLISKCLLGGGLLALICGIFCFFGGAVTMSIDASVGTITSTISPLFAFMFGTEYVMKTPGYPDQPAPPEAYKLVGGLTTLFVLEMLIIVLAVVLLVGIFAKKLQKKQITIIGCVVCVLALVAVILAFCSKKMICNAMSEGEAGYENLFKLGSAGISYGVLGIVGMLATGAGLFLGKDQAVAA